MKRIAFLMLVVAAVLSCSKVDNEPTPYRKVTLGTKSAEVNASSPLSASLNMALLLNGADGTTYATVNYPLAKDTNGLVTLQ